MFRAIPLVLLIFFAFLGIPRITGNSLEPFGALVVGLTLYNGSVFAEIFRAGIRAVPKGQVEAASASGSPAPPSPGWSSSRRPCAHAAHDRQPDGRAAEGLRPRASSSPTPSCCESGRRIYTNVGNVIPTAIVVAAIYIAINLALTTVATWLERRGRAGRGRGGRATIDAPPIAADGGLSSI